ncbi:MAG: pirin family protein [Candidatus Eisenbacteria bacterium]|nr:pirin family protein [Candidatus Eisenbacteria bacterium]
MIRMRPAGERGHANHGWLDTRHTFSFANYYDPEHMGFRSLRVINEDRVQPGAGFGPHAHRDMEIITFVMEGALEHRDSMGTGSVLRADDIQRMSAGTGIVHSEYNHSKQNLLHFLQIWILPSERGLQPSYEQRTFDADSKRGRLRLVAAPGGRDRSLTLHQDARIYAGLLESGQELRRRLEPARHAWVQVVGGALKLNGHAMSAGDGAGISEEDELRLEASAEGAEIIVFDLA